MAREAPAVGERNVQQPRSSGPTRGNRGDLEGASELGDARRNRRHRSASHQQTGFRLVDDSAELDRDAESALVTGDLDELLRIAERHADQGRTAAALDLLFAALATTPGEPRLYIAIARLHLALGWRSRTVGEVARLARLVEITGDEDARDALAGFVNAALAPAAGRAAPAV